MNQLNDICDEDFIPFLHRLGVDTYKKSFEWLLNDPDFAGVLRWMYGALDENNALTAREDYRYLELEKKQMLLKPEELDNQIKNIQDQFHGICLCGDKVGLDNIKMDISMQTERLAMLTKHDNILQEVTSKNEQIKEDLTVELTHLNAALQQCSEDESTTAEECEKLAEEVENMTDGIMDVISDALEQYTNTQTDKEMSQKFFTFGPFESYRQSQALFRSHFDLYTTKKFNKKQNDNISVEELQNVLTEARSLEERLTAAAYAYIESKAELSGEQAKFALVTNYTPVHPSQITIATMEAQSALELLEQEEGITTQQLQSVIKQLVDSRTKMAVNTTVKAAMAVREQVHQELIYLHDVCLQALSIDRALYSALRYELRTIEELLQFAAQLWVHTTDERAAVAKRIELMNEICSEQEACEIKLHDSNPLFQILCKILNMPDTNHATIIIKAYNELRNNLKRMKEEIQDEYKKSGNNFPTEVVGLLNSAISAPASAPLLSTLTHTLTATITQTDNSILHATDTFTSIKKGDKQNLRKLWQWFLTDQQRLIAAVKQVSPKPALSLLTGFVVRTRPQATGCWLGYASRSDPRGALPSWLVNKVTAQLAPRLVQQLQAAARKYPGWKALTDSPYYKPWRHPEQVPPYRISLEDCIDPDAPPLPPENTDQKPVSSKSKLFVPQAKEIESHSVEDLGDISSEFSVEVEEETIDQPDPTKRKGKFYKLVKSMKNRRKSVQVAKSADNLMDNKPDEKLDKKKPFKFHRRFSMSRGKDD